MSLQGGFAKCYELLDLNTNKVYAGKIISKQRLTKPHQRQKVCILTLISSTTQNTCSLAHAFESWIFSDNVLQNLFISIAYHAKPLKTNLNFTVMKVHKFFFIVRKWPKYTCSKSADKRAAIFFFGGGVLIPVTKMIGSFSSLSQLTYPEDAILHISICLSNRESSFPGEIYEGG